MKKENPLPAIFQCGYQGCSEPKMLDEYGRLLTRCAKHKGKHAKGKHAAKVKPRAVRRAKANPVKRGAKRKRAVRRVKAKRAKRRTH